MFVFSQIYRIYVITFLPFSLQVVDIKQFANTCYEDDPQYGSWGSISGRYHFWIDFPDDVYEELYQVWYNYDGHLNNWNINWDGHDKLYNTITQVATEMLNKVMQERQPECRRPWRRHVGDETHWASAENAQSHQRISDNNRQTNVGDFVGESTHYRTWLIHFTEERFSETWRQG